MQERGGADCAPADDWSSSHAGVSSPGSRCLACLRERERLSRSRSGFVWQPLGARRRTWTRCERCGRPGDGSLRATFSPPSTPRRCKRATSCVLSPRSTASRGGGREADRTQLPRARASARASGADPPRRRDLTRADPFACVPRYRSHESRDGARSSERPQAGPIATARMSCSSRRRPSSATWAASIASSGSLPGSASVLHHVPGLDSDRVRGEATQLRLPDECVGCLWGVTPMCRAPGSSRIGAWHGKRLSFASSFFSTVTP
jgi:hypothetical protein